MERGDDELKSAMCGGHLMRHGEHYAEFEIRHGTDVTTQPGVGLARPQHNLDDGMFNSACCWVYDTTDGGVFHPDSGSEATFECEGLDGAEQGDTVGLLLDLTAGTLTVYRNGKRLGVAVHPELPGVPPLTGPLSWAVEVCDGSAVHIQHGQPPPQQQQPATGA